MAIKIIIAAFIGVILGNITWEFILKKVNKRWIKNNIDQCKTIRESPVPFVELKWKKNKPETVFYIEKGKKIPCPQCANIVKKFLEAKDNPKKFKYFIEKVLLEKWQEI